MQANVASLAGQLADHVNKILAGGTVTKLVDDGTGTGTFVSVTVATYPGGVTMAGNAGKALFVFNPAGGANMLKVDANFQTADLAFAKKPTAPDPYEPGDISNLHTILGLKDLKIDLPGWTMSAITINDADTQLVGKLGVFSQQNKSSLATGNTVRMQAEQDWASTSGVNQDEEAVNLVEYQKMYQANMKVISVANSLFDTILQTMG
jgi:flagellar hook-associated protein 1 FlgK